MIRETLTSGSSYSLMGFSPSGAFRWQARSSSSGSTTSVPSSATIPPNVWVRLVRTGNTITGYQSVDGSYWSDTGTSTHVMAANIYIGVAVAFGSSTTLNTSTFNNVMVVP